MISRKAALVVSTALTVTLGGASALYAQERAEQCTELERVSGNAPDRLFEAAEGDREAYAGVVEEGDGARCEQALNILRDAAEENDIRLAERDSDSATAEANAQASDSMQAVESDRTTVRLSDQVTVEGTVYLDREPPSVEVQEGEDEVIVTPGRSDVNVNEQAAEIVVKEQPAQISVEMVQPTISIEQPAPEIIITMPEPGVDVANADPQVEVRTAKPKVTVSQSSPSVRLDLQVAEDVENSDGVEIEDSRTGERYAQGETGELATEDADAQITRTEPKVTMQRPASQDEESRVQISRAEPSVSYQRAEPKVNVTQSGEATVEVTRVGEPKVTINRPGERDKAEAGSNRQSGSDDQQLAQNAQPDSNGAENDDMAQSGEQSDVTDQQMAQGEQPGQQTGQDMNDQTAMQDGSDDMQQSSDQAAADQDRGPSMQVDGYQTAEAGTFTADELTGAEFYGSEERMGEVSEAVVGSNAGEVTDLVVDIGGFLGLGAHSVAIPFDEVEIMRAESGDDLRVYVDMTREDMEQMPEYEE